MLPLLPLPLLLPLLLLLPLPLPLLLPLLPLPLETGCLGNAFLFTDSNVEERQRINKQLQLIQSGGATPSLRMPNQSSR